MSFVKIKLANKDISDDDVMVWFDKAVFSRTASKKVVRFDDVVYAEMEFIPRNGFAISVSEFYFETDEIVAICFVGHDNDDDTSMANIFIGERKSMGESSMMITPSGVFRHLSKISLYKMFRRSFFSRGFARIVFSGSTKEQRVLFDDTVTDDEFNAFYADLFEGIDTK